MNPKPNQKLSLGAGSYVTITWKGFSHIPKFFCAPLQCCLGADVSYFLCCTRTTKEIGDVCTQANCSVIFTNSEKNYSLDLTQMVIYMLIQIQRVADKLLIIKKLKGFVVLIFY